MKQVSVLVGAGSIGQAIFRRVSDAKHVVLADNFIGGILHLHVLRHIERDNGDSSICRLNTFWRVSFIDAVVNEKWYLMTR